jgi:hypothetical protein
LGFIVAIAMLRSAAAGHPPPLTAQDYETPLHLACEIGHEGLVSYLISMGADVNAGASLKPPFFGSQKRPRPSRGERPIHLAAESGTLGCVMSLLRASAQVNVRTAEGDTPLHLAAERGHLEVVAILMLAGALPNARNAEEGGAPLHYASINGFVEVVRHLTSNGASVDVLSRQTAAPDHAELEAMGMLPPILVSPQTAVEAATQRLAHIRALPADDPIWEEAPRAKHALEAGLVAVVEHLESFDPLTQFWSRHTHWECLPWARAAAHQVLLVAERLWRLKSSLFLPVEIWPLILSFVKRQELSSLRALSLNNHHLPQQSTGGGGGGGSAATDVGGRRRGADPGRAPRRQRSAAGSGGGGGGGGAATGGASSGT